MGAAELVVFQGGLPTAPIEEVSRFLLFAPEKLKSIKAEICYINKLDVAQEVLEQKQEEERQLAELILDASVRVGELTKLIPKGSGGNRRGENFKINNADNFEKTKSDRVKELGFSQQQVSRFEALADNKDLVEQVKAISRETGDIPTRTQVLKLAQQRKKAQETPPPEPIVVERMDRESERESIKRHVAELKDDTIERTYTTDMFMVEYRDYVSRSVRGLEWYKQEPYASLYAELSEDEKQEMMALNTALLETIKSINKHLKG